MKTPALILLMAGTAAATPLVLPRTSQETLARLQGIDPLARYQRPEAVAAPAAARPSIIRQSTLLHDGVHWTLVPAGAVVHVPASLKQRVGTAPAGTLLPWSDFLALNRGWLTTVEISLEQASGKQALPAERAAFWEKQDRIVIATHRGGPISLHQSEPQPLASNP